MFPVKDILLETTIIYAKPAKGFWTIFQSIWTQTKPIFQEPLGYNTWKMSYIVFIILAIGQGNAMW